MTNIKLDKLEKTLDKFATSLEDYLALNKFLKSAIASDQIAICTLDKDGYFLDVNEACCELWERSREDLLTLRYQDITFHKDLEQDEANAIRVVEGKIGHYSMAKRYIMPKGRKKPCWLEVSTIPRSDGKFWMYLSKILSKDNLEFMLHQIDVLEAH